jgi:hypothetical protein
VRYLLPFGSCYSSAFAAATVCAIFELLALAVTLALQCCAAAAAAIWMLPLLKMALLLPKCTVKK